MDEDGGRVRVRGPLGLSRTATTKVVATERPTLLTGAAQIGRGTRGAVRWEIEPVPGGSRVRFRAEVERAGVLVVRAAVQRLGAVVDAQPPSASLWRIPRA